jgi:hypothetical protein
LSNNFRSEAKINSLNQAFIEKWLKDHPMVESFDCTAESPAGELFEFPRFEWHLREQYSQKKIRGENTGHSTNIITLEFY